MIEAKLSEDDGTARDKVARVQRLRTLRDEAGHGYDVIACIAGRGFKVRREDMRRLLQATDGKVFTLSTMHLLIDHAYSGVSVPRLGCHGLEKLVSRGTWGWRSRGRDSICG